MPRAKQPAAAKAKQAPQPKAEPKAPEVQTIVVDQDYLDSNPNLVEAGVVIGDSIEIPAEQPKAANKPASQPAAAAKGPKASEGKMFGNKDKDGDYEFPKSWEKAVVVRQSDFKNVGEGGIEDYIEVPSTVKLAPYEPEMFEFLEKNNGFGSTKKTIIHDPR